MIIAAAFTGPPTQNNCSAILYTGNRRDIFTNNCTVITLVNDCIGEDLVRISVRRYPQNDIAVNGLKRLGLR